MRSWNLTERLQESVAHHHNPSAAKNYAMKLSYFFTDHISHEIIDNQDDEHPRCKISPSA